LNPADNFDHWLSKANASTSTIAEFQLFLPQFETLLDSVRESRVLPTPIKITADQFGTLLCQSIIDPLIQKQRLSESAFDGLVEILSFFIRYSIIGFLHNLQSYFGILDRIFRLQSNLTSWRPSVRETLAKTLVEDQPLFDSLCASLASDTLPLPLIATFSAAVLPAFPLPDRADLPRAIVAGVQRSLARDFRGTNSQVVFHILCQMNNILTRDLVVLWLDGVTLPGWQCDVFEKQLLGLRIIRELLNSRRDWVQQCLDWITSHFADFDQLPVHTETVARIGFTWAYLVYCKKIDFRRVADLWQRHVSQPQSLLQPFFSMFVTIAKCCPAELFPELRELFFRPGAETPEWLDLLEKTILQIETRAGFLQEVQRFKGKVQEVASSDGPLKKLAAAVLPRLAAIGIAPADFLNEIKQALTGTVSNYRYLSDLLDRHKFPEAATADQLFEVIVSSVKEMSRENRLIGYEILQKLINKHNVTFDAAQMTQVFNLVFIDIRAFDLVKQLRANKKFPLAQFVPLAETVKKEQICQTFYSIIQGIFNWDILEALPFQWENLLWTLCNVHWWFHSMLVCCYCKNDEKRVGDNLMIETFLEQWRKHFEAYKRPNLYISLLICFLDHLEGPFELPIKRHKTVPQSDRIQVVVEGFEPLVVSPDLTVAALLRRLKGTQYGSFTLVANETYQEPLTDMRKLAGTSNEVKCRLVVKQSQTFRKRSVFPTAILVESPVFEILYEQLKTGTGEIRQLLDKLPTFPRICEAVRSVGDDSDFQQLFPTGFPLVFLYNFEALLAEVPLKDISSSCLNYLVKGLTVYCGNLMTSVLSWLNKNWSLPVDLQLLFDSYWVLLRFLVQNIKDYPNTTLTALEFGQKFANQNIQVTADVGDLVFTLLNSPTPAIRSRSCSFFQKLSIPFSVYSDRFVEPIPDLTAEFYCSLGHHLEQNTPTIIKELWKVVQNGPAEPGHLECLAAVLQRGGLSTNAVNQFVRHMTNMYFKYNKSHRSAALWKAACHVLSCFPPGYFSAHFDNLIKLAGYQTWRVDGDILEVSLDGRVGLTNLGMTCYVNSVIQQFFAIPEFRSAVLTYNGSDQVAKEVRSLFARLRFSHCRFESPQNVTDVWTTNGTRLNKSVQEDACVFIQDFLDKLEKPVPATVTLFRFSIFNRLETVEGIRLSENEENFNVLPLAVKNCSNLQQSFATLLQSDLVKGYRTPDGKVLDARKFPAIRSLPRHLIIQLNRFEYQVASLRRYKITSPYDFGFEQTIQDQKYILSGVIAHHGNVDGGHYVSYVRDEGKWFCFNDRVVQEVTEKVLVNESTHDGYVLFYRMAGDQQPEKIAAGIQQSVEGANNKLHLQRIFSTRAFAEAMTVWAGSGDEIVVKYLFCVLPYCAAHFGPYAEKIAEKLVKKPLRFDPGRYASGDALLWCPVVEIRSAACAVFFVMFQGNPNADALKLVITTMIDVSCSERRYYNTFDQCFGLVLRIVREVEEGRRQMVEMGHCQRLQKFVMNDFPAFVEARKKAGVKEAEFYAETSWSNCLRVLAALPATPELRTFCLAAEWLDRMLSSQTELMAVVELLRSFENRQEVVSVLTGLAGRPGKADTFTLLITNLIDST
jgi:ubiquitin C-terminal hydrolase